MKTHSFQQGYVTKMSQDEVRNDSCDQQTSGFAVKEEFANIFGLDRLYTPSTYTRGALLPQNKTLKGKSSTVLCNTVVDMATVTKRKASGNRLTVHVGAAKSCWYSHIRQCIEMSLPHTGLTNKIPCFALLG